MGLWLKSQADRYIEALEVQVARHIFYDQGPGRCTPNTSGYADCSGFMCYGAKKAGLDFGCTGSFALATWAHNAGLQISIDEARRTRAAWVFRGANEGRGGRPGIDPGHVEMSRGDGTTIGARGHRAGVGVFPFDSLSWDGAYRVPGLSYRKPAPPPPPPPPPPKVKPMYQPSLKIVDTHVSHGYTTAGANGTWMLQPDGAIYTVSGSGGKYWGGANTDPNFVGRVAEQLVAPGANVEGANPAPANEAGAGYVYIVVAGTGERYGYPRGGGVK